MLALRHLTLSPCIRQIVLCRSLKTKPQKMAHMVHKEIMKYIDQYARIKIQSDILLKIRAADVHRYPNANVLVAELQGAHVKNCNVEMSVENSEDDKQIDIKIKLNNDSNRNEDGFRCVLAVPVKAALNVEGKNAVYIEQMLGEKLEVFAQENIQTRDVRCELISLKSIGGDIVCNGMLLGHNTILETKQNNSVKLDKLQGDDFICKTEAGSINCNCCYVENSNFQTNSGRLDLKNVHKRSRVLINNAGGSLHMTGVHGNTQVQSRGKILNLQLSELHDDNLIVADDAECATINISDCIEQTTALNITAQSIKLDENLTHLTTNLDEKAKRLNYEPTLNPEIKLTVRAPNGNVQLGKLSWAEMMAKNFENKPLA